MPNNASRREVYSESSDQLWTFPYTGHVLLPTNQKLSADLHELLRVTMPINFTTKLKSPLVHRSSGDLVQKTLALRDYDQ